MGFDLPSRRAFPLDRAHVGRCSGERLAEPNAPREVEIISSHTDAMNYDDWFRNYNDPEAPTLRKAFAKAFAGGAVDDNESFNDWCRAEYEWYLRNPADYEVPYTGLLD